MTSPKVFIEEQLALRTDMVSRLESMRKHLARPSSEGAVGMGRNYEDVTEEAVANLERQIAELDERVERLRSGNA